MNPSLVKPWQWTLDPLFRYMMYEMLDEAVQSKLHIFSSFFYTRLNNAFADKEGMR